jgi:hypothetical protein
MKRHRIPIYGGLLVVCRTVAEAEAAFRRLAGHEPREDCSGGMRDGEVLRGQHAGDLLLVAGIYTDAPDLVCHEAVHCAQFIAERVGMDPLAELEAFAYLTQWLLAQLAAVGAS